MIRAHNIKANETSRVPRRWVFLDTEAQEKVTERERVQTFRLAVTAFDRSDTDTLKPIATQWQTHESPTQLWSYIANHTRRRSRTVVVAHNLAYDLRISDAFTCLAAEGFTMSRLAVHQRAVSASFRRGDRTLLLVDSMSWLPMALDKVGALVALDKMPLPAFTDCDDAWERRCRRDVEILRTAYLGLVEWVRSSDLGNWQKTAAGMAWANWRHCHYTHTVTVHDDERAQEVESQSAYTGRCEAWRHGEHTGEKWVEWDLPLAYPRIAQAVKIPTNLQGTVTRGDWPTYLRMIRNRRALIRADVSTELPTLPVRQGDRTLWPVGQFEGWWWDCELVNAAEHGAEIRPRCAYIYTARDALREWAEWIIHAVESPTSGLSSLQRAAVKTWARALIGRFATRFTTWEPQGRAIDPGVGVHPIADLGLNRVGKVLTIGDEQWVGWDESFGTDACVSIMAAIMAECRVRLWQLMTTAGLDNVAYVDTDSLIVNAEGSNRLRALVANGGGWGLRVKARYRHLTVLGPRQLIVEHRPRVAGIPKGAELHPSNVWIGETWEGLDTALSRGRQNQVVIRPGVWRLKGRDNRRTHLPNGLTAPLSVGLSPTT